MSRRGFAYVAGSAGGESTATANREAFARWRVVPRMLVDTSERDLGVELFGRRHAVTAARRPDRGALRGARRRRPRGGPGGASSSRSPPSSAPRRRCPMEEVAAALGGAGHWYQLYWSRDDDLVASLVRRAEACGSEAVVVTLDTAYLGWRPRDLDLGHLPFARGRGHRPVHLRPGVPAARRGAGGGGRGPHRGRAAAPADPGRGAHPGRR